MFIKVIGIQLLDFASPSGDHIEGTNIFGGFKDEAVDGLRTEKFFVKKEVELPKELKIGDTVNIFFNHKGKVEAISK